MKGLDGSNPPLSSNESRLTAGPVWRHGLVIGNHRVRWIPRLGNVKNPRPQAIFDAARDRDMTGQIVEPSPITPPSLLELRQGTAPQPRPKLPTPGGIGAGIYYYNGQLQAIHGSNLQTTMIVHPTTGLDPSNSGLTWLFTTSTNRTQMGVEVVGMFFQNNPNESLGIYDWSCSVSYPCEQGTTGSPTNPSPAWIWVTLMSNLACYTKTELSDAGFVDQVMQYMNQTNELVAGNPPTWENEVYLLNYCDNH
jgi:hypothetical protein